MYSVEVTEKQGIQTEKLQQLEEKALLGAYKVLDVCNEIFLMLGGGYSASPTL